MSDNPLSRYFRQPAIFIQLPSQGRFYPPGTLEPSATNEYPVLPMTTMDEITYRTPDALFNGTAVVSVIQSCVPNIKDAWQMPAVDLDTVLVAIRIATYGHSMDISTQCPKCEHESDYALDLNRVMASISAPDYSQSMQHGDLEIHFKPLTYHQMNQNNLLQFQDQKMLQMLDDDSVTEQDKAEKLGELLRKITEVTTKALASSIAAVKTPAGTVINPVHVEEWLANCDRQIYSKIRDHVIESKRSSEIKPLQIVCSSCSHQYEQVFTLDMTSFFGSAS